MLAPTTSCGHVGRTCINKDNQSYNQAHSMSVQHVFFMEEAFKVRAVVLEKCLGGKYTNYCKV